MKFELDVLSRLAEKFTEIEQETSLLSFGFVSYVGLCWLLASRSWSPPRGAPSGKFGELFGIYLENIRILYHSTFLVVLLGSLYSDRAPCPHPRKVAVLYPIFNILLYGGIYTLNQITDMKSDQAHPRKSNRPLASGRMSVVHAYAFVALSWTLGLSGAYALHGTQLVNVFLVFIGLNLFYSLWAREQPVLDILTNACTYPLRFMMGGIVCGIEITPISVLAVYGLGLMLVTTKRIFELRGAGWDSRKSLLQVGPMTQFGLHYGAFLLVVTVSLFFDHGDILLFSRILLLAVLFLSGTSNPSTRNSGLLIAAVAAVNAKVVPYAYGIGRIFFVVDSIAILLFVVVFSLAVPGGLAGIFEKISTF